MLLSLIHSWCRKQTPQMSYIQFYAMHGRSMQRGSSHMTYAHAATKIINRRAAKP